MTHITDKRGENLFSNFDNQKLFHMIKKWRIDHSWLNLAQDIFSCLRWGDNFTYWTTSNILFVQYMSSTQLICAWETSGTMLIKLSEQTRRRERDGKEKKQTWMIRNWERCFTKEFENFTMILYCVEIFLGHYTFSLNITSFCNVSNTHTHTRTHRHYQKPELVTHPSHWLDENSGQYQPLVWFAFNMCATSSYSSDCWIVLDVSNPLGPKYTPVTFPKLTFFLWFLL